MTDYSELLPEVLPDVPGCTDPLAERAIRDAVIRLCELSDIIKETSTPVDVVADEPHYEIIVPDEYAYNQVLWVTVANGQPLKEYSQDFLDLSWGSSRRDLFSTHGHCSSADGWRALKQQRPEVYFIARGDTFDQLRLVGTPSMLIVDGLQYQISLKPLRSSTGVREFVAEDHYKVIAKGAIGALLSVNKKAWTDLPRGRTLTAEFEADCKDLKRLSLKDFTRDDQANIRTRAYS